MERVDYLVLQTLEEVFDFQPKILELGARIIDQQDELSIRRLFGEKSNPEDYLGVDFIEGEGVDLVANVQDLPLEDGGFNSIIAMNLLEHVEKFWLVMDEMKRLLSDSGIIVISTPFSYDVHGCPYDYFRFTPFYYESQLRHLRYRLHISVGARNRPKLVYCIAGNDPRIEQLYPQLRKTLLERHDKMVPAGKKLVYKLRSKLAGNHFREMIGEFGNLNIDLFIGDDVPEGWK